MMCLLQKLALIDFLGYSPFLMEMLGKRQLLTFLAPLGAVVVKGLCRFLAHIVEEHCGSNDDIWVIFYLSGRQSWIHGKLVKE